MILIVLIISQLIINIISLDVKTEPVLAFLWGEGTWGHGSHSGPGWGHGEHEQGDALGVLLGVSSALSLAGAWAELDAHPELAELRLYPHSRLSPKRALFCHKCNGQRICFFIFFWFIFPELSVASGGGHPASPRLPFCQSGFGLRRGRGGGAEPRAAPIDPHRSRASLAPARAGARGSPASPKGLTALAPRSSGKWN